MQTHSKISFTFLFGAALFLNACVSGEASSGASVRDSSGITIVESTAPAWTPETQLHLAEHPRLTLGGPDAPEEQQFGQPRNALRLKNGRIAVADRFDNSISFFDSDGNFLRKEGREGEGPGEYRGIWWMKPWLGDSIVVLDVGLSRLAVLDFHGRFVRTITVTKTSDNPNPSPLDVFSDGTFFGLVTRFGQPPDDPGTVVEEREAHRLWIDGNVLSLTAVVRRNRYWGSFGRSLQPIPIPFSTTTEWAVRDTVLYFVQTDRYEVMHYTFDGNLIRIARAPGEPVRVSSADRGIASDRLIGATDRPEVKAILRAALGRMPELEFKPFFGRPAWDRAPSSLAPRPGMMADDAGRVWVLEYAMEEHLIGKTWTVFGHEGVWLGRVEFPEGFVPFQIGKDFVLGWRLDDMDLMLIEVFDLVVGNRNVAD